MANTPHFVIDKSIVTRWRVSFQAESLNVEEVGSPRIGLEGVEQDWRCFDKSGDLFRFTVCEVSRHNALRIDAGSLVLVVGPSARQNVSSAFTQFERVLTSLGALKRT